MKYVHYTNSYEALLSILAHGFIINPCERNVLGFFSNRHEFSDREPQYFGMVCLHGFSLLPNYKYWNTYGPFGIEMSPKWVAEKSFQKVLYVGSSDASYDSLKNEFDSALKEVDEAVSLHPNDGVRQMAYINKNVAGVLGAQKWAEFLSLFEYMETAENEYQNEWRFTRKEPLYDDKPLPEKIVSVQNDLGWSRHIYPLTFKRSDVTSIHAPKSAVETLRQQVPVEYRDIEIRSLYSSLFNPIRVLSNMFLKRM